MGTDRGSDDAVGCVLAVLACPFLALEKLRSLPQRRHRARLIAAGKMPCPHCSATLYLEGRSTCPACLTTSWGSYLSCGNPACTWTTDAVDCPTCKATVFV